MILDGSKVNILIAFIAGFITFFASCLVPLVPSYLAYISGLVLNSDTKITKNERFHIFSNSLFFVTGFILIFLLFGISANTVLRKIFVHDYFINLLGGIFLILTGLVISGHIKVSALLKERKFFVKKDVTKWHKANSFIFGLVFGFAWTPCIGPVLAVILFWAGRSETLLQGLLLLFSYGIGLGLPFLIIGLFFNFFAPKLSGAGKIGYYLNKASGYLLVIFGIFMLSGKLTYISLSLLNIFGLETLAR